MPMVYLSDQANLELEKYRLQVNRETNIACDRSDAILKLIKEKANTPDAYLKDREMTELERTPLLNQIKEKA